MLPYRAGYEAADRREIQRALEQGKLTGVVSTSALELGLDIGDMELIVLLDTPLTVKAFWQRIGRAGRRQAGVCLLIDSRGALGSGQGALARYMGRPLETSWLYLENRYIQYTNALCAALELSQLAAKSADHPPFASLPESFRKMLANELQPTEAIPPDLYPLKQRAQAGPHREFPIRNGIERQFTVGDGAQSLGSLTFSQVLREAYPGGIHYYMARPYRVAVFNFMKSQVVVRREKRWTTRPISQAMVFPRFLGGVLNLALSDSGFVAECEMQVSERVQGFVEQRGPNKEEHRYGPLSPYSTRELNRFFETTGVCWFFQKSIGLSEAIASRVLEAFCVHCGVHERDLGVGRFHAKQSPLGEHVVQGICIFDVTTGSLRLTQRLVDEFAPVVALAIGKARAEQEATAIRELEKLGALVVDLQRVAVGPGIGATDSGEQDSDWVTVIADGESAMFHTFDGAREVRVRTYRYTPRGGMYELEPERRMANWIVTATAVQPINGVTRMIRRNLTTGETKELDE
jgi:DEAD/DEAH box helicase domain-containing protein